ncbi:MAG: OsmC family peroxiredoxin [Chitinivibrionales bacterium]|nr:OsmC family peroxiredoxin [Chitinivibrionales bacterium]
MSEHSMQIEWKRGDTSFDYQSYTRDHAWIIEGNRVCASASPDFFGNPSCVDPEQAFVASLASCHMLTFLALASKKRFVVDTYKDNAVGVLGRNESRKPAVVSIELKPEVVFSGERIPNQEEFDALHDKAHDACFIANSIASCVKVSVNATLQTII